MVEHAKQFQSTPDGWTVPGLVLGQIFTPGNGQ